MCRSCVEGKRRCKESDNPSKKRRRRAAKRQQEAQKTVRAFIGATPFRPESEALLSMSSRDSYYDSDEWAEWSDRIRVVAERHGVEIREGSGVEHADGLWMGEKEPSGAYVVEGSREAVTRWAAEIAGRYEQDAVMVLFADKDGKDNLYRFEGNQTQVQDALDAMQAAGIPGGRVLDGRLEIVSTHDNPVSPRALELIRQRLGADEVTRAPITATFVEKDESFLAYAPIKEIQSIRQQHAERHGLPVRPACPHLTDQDDIALAMAYEKGQHDPHHPKIKRSYRALRRHIVEQHDALTAAGYTFTPWTGEGQPYASSAEMLADLRSNRHLYFFRTEVSQDTNGALPLDHPMAQEVTVRDADGNEQHMVANDVFRAVHDAISHSEGHKFGPHGEKMAWFTHRSSLPREAHLALLNETRAQNVVTNAGRHMRTSDGAGGQRLLKKGEPGWTDIADRPYAEQKCVVLPDAFT